MTIFYVFRIYEILICVSSGFFNIQQHLCIPGQTRTTRHHEWSSIQSIWIGVRGEGRRDQVERIYIHIHTHAWNSRSLAEYKNIAYILVDIAFQNL